MQEINFFYVKNYNSLMIIGVLKNALSDTVKEIGGIVVVKLAELGIGDGAGILMEFVRSENTQLRIDSWRAINLLDTPICLRAENKLMTSPVFEVSYYCMTYISRFADFSVMKNVFSILDNETNVAIFMAGLDSLAKINHLGCFNYFSKYCESKDINIRTKVNETAFSIDVNPEQRQKFIQMAFVTQT